MTRSSSGNTISVERRPRPGSRAVVSLAAGEGYRLWELSHPTFHRYAKRIGAEWVLIGGTADQRTSLLSLKVADIYRLLGCFERICFVDGDVIVRNDCPDLFELVPFECVGGTDEGATELLYSRKGMRRQALEMALQYYAGVQLGDREPYVFFNTGVMVLSSIHREMLLPPKPLKRITAWVDMPFINAMLFKTGHPFHDLGFKFNYVGSMALHDDRPFEPWDAYIFHATGGLSAGRRKAGEESEGDGVEYRYEWMQTVIDHWERQASAASGDGEISAAR